MVEPENTIDAMKPRKDKQRLSPSESCLYECELIEGETLEGVISSSNQIDVYFVDHANFSAWMIGQTFDHDCCRKSVFTAEIKYLAPKEGTWFLLIENNGETSATLEILINVSSQ